MHLQRKVLAALAILGIVATFLTWTPLPLHPVKDRWITLALFVTSMTICIGGDQKTALTGKFIWGIILTCGLASIIAITHLIKLEHYSYQAGTSDLPLVSGPWVAVLSGILILIFAFLLKGRKATERD